MHNLYRVLIVNGISLPIYASVEEAFSLVSRRLKKYAIFPTDAKFSVYRRSVDARKKDDIKFVYSIAVEGVFGQISDTTLKEIGAVFDRAEEPFIEMGNEKLTSNPVVVGTGPAGLFCSLLLAENGYRPIILERGGSVRERVAQIKTFRKTRVLDENCNIQFGAGGAGTFSDGKLITRINDGMTGYVLKRFVEFGAPSEILYIAKPHIGTDILCSVVDNMLKRIEELGGVVHYNTKFIDADFENDQIGRLTTSKGEFNTGALILAVGHSARDTYSTLIKNNLSVEAKNFSVGMRIEHLAETIDKAMYGKFAGNSDLGHAEYALSYNTKVRGVYTFCMCPGGEVVAATSTADGVVVNGMSENARNGKNSNSAVVCSVFKEDYGNSPLSAINFQKIIEHKAFLAGGGNYNAPFITVGDFLKDKLSSEPKSVLPSYLDGGVKPASPYDYLPSFVCDGIKNAIYDFNKKIEGFSADDAILTGAETRTSAPIRILRDKSTNLAIGYRNLYPAGEGAGYAGGITSASIDGVRIALSMMKKYSPIFRG